MIGPVDDTRTSTGYAYVYTARAEWNRSRRPSPRTTKALDFWGFRLIAGERFVLIGDHSVLVERVVPWP